jgi:hypothetical protein
MKRFRKLRMPSPAMLIAVIALVVALGGTAYAAKKLGLSALSNGAKNKTVGVGKLTYVNVSASVPESIGDEDSHQVSANCPAGLKPLGGGVKLTPHHFNFWWSDGYLTATGFAANVFNYAGSTRTAVVTVACGVSRSVTGTPAA